MSQLSIQQLFDLAFAHHQAGRLKEASRLYQEILFQQPTHAEALHYLGGIAHQAGRNDVALDLIRKAIAVKPDYLDAYSNLGKILGIMGRVDEAVATFRQLVALSPEFPHGYYNLGVALMDAGCLDDAATAFRHAISIKPDHAPSHNNLGEVLWLTEQYDAAVAAYRSAVSVDPDFGNAHWNLATVLLQQGNLSEGWKEYEWRWKFGEAIQVHHNFAQPLWDGSSLQQRRILVHAEQGLGDTLQFVRYLPSLAREGTVVLECQPQLKRLLQLNAKGWKIIGVGETIPEFDLHCPLLGLPMRLGTSIDTIPAEIPYLHAEPKEISKWRQRLDAIAAGKKVGLVWAGNPATHGDEVRSPRQLSLLAPLAAVENVRFISLQKGDAGVQAKKPPDGMQLVNWTGELRDFTDTAALVANLDLIISSDTSVLHLAGALGKPVWVLLPYEADWRWMLDRQDSPWYPTARLFRQPTRGDWPSVVVKVAKALSQWEKERA